jgi:hypothetical protein
MLAQCRYPLSVGTDPELIRSATCRAVGSGHCQRRPQSKAADVYRLGTHRVRRGCRVAALSDRPASDVLEVPRALIAAGSPQGPEIASANRELSQRHRIEVSPRSSPAERLPRADGLITAKVRKCWPWR